ncbi:undecaprenyl-diphosphate phosphatase [Taklimakanibacter deserti]|uniref:undecaprenyl-diphosphate phosphatase n=1 Tax=Taklimakanibacter deserti TaxID=2267839 RepID=UPI000E646BB8
MPIEQIILLALIQGITEFLPISSSGHLILAPALFHWADQGVLTDIMTHMGSLLAVLVYFWRDVVAMLRGSLDALRGRITAEGRLAFYVVIGTIPIILVGAFLKFTGLSDQLRSVTLVAVNAIVFGILMYIADAYGLMRRKVSDMTWVPAVIVGCAQALSLNPGTSRSGITMTAARGLGFERPEAARFSFLLSIPATAAAGLLIIGDALERGVAITWDSIICGALTFVVAFATIAFLMQLLRRMSFLPFVIYRIALGVILLALIYWGFPLSVAST